AASPALCAGVPAGCPGIPVAPVRLRGWHHRRDCATLSGRKRGSSRLASKPTSLQKSSGQGGEGEGTDGPSDPAVQGTDPSPGQSTKRRRDPTLIGMPGAPEVPTADVNMPDDLT